jgi:hypothetical protein
VGSTNAILFLGLMLLASLFNSVPIPWLCPKDALTGGINNSKKKDSKL